MRAFLLSILLAGLILVSWRLEVAWSAQSERTRVNAPRADGNTTPLVVYAARGAGSECAPLAIISHGAGGSENGYRYLGEGMSRLGYTAVIMGHRESGMSALGADMRAHGIKDGVRALVADPQAEQVRLLDIGAALKWADSQCKAPFRVLLGHSMGAITVMLEVGATDTIGVSSSEAAKDRFDAYVALSPEGPGVVFSEHSWTGIHKPVLVLTGTRDQALQGGPPSRQVAWRDMPGSAGKCQWMGVIDDATHMNFAGIGLGSERVDRMVTETIGSFLEGVRAGACALPATKEGMTLQAK